MFAAVDVTPYRRNLKGVGRASMIDVVAETRNEETEYFQITTTKQVCVINSHLRPTLQARTP